MKKIIFIGVLLAILLAAVLPVAVLANDCCELSGCCREACCAELTQWYKVSYFSGNHTWISVYIETHDRNEAAELLGLEAGYNCFVVRVFGVK